MSAISGLDIETVNLGDNVKVRRMDDTLMLIQDGHVVLLTPKVRENLREYERITAEAEEVQS